MLRSFMYKALLVTIIAFHVCNTKYLLVELDDKIAKGEKFRNVFPSLQMMGKCSAYCIGCSKGKPSCQPNCSDNRKYFECQSTCVESGKNGPKKCIKNTKCLQKCDKQCSKLWQGKHTAETKSLISDYIKRSNLANPYGFKNELWKWAYITNSPKKTKKYNKVSTYSIQSRNIKEENRPGYYMNKPDTKLEKEISTWDISYNDLLPFYVKAYQERFIEWKNKFDACSDTVIKRRISWLYPEEFCWTRAYYFAKKVTELVREHFKKISPAKTFADPYKHYMFGIFIRDVQKGTPGEFLRWDMHVAPIIKLQDSELYILDPMVSKVPMKKADFHAEIGNPENKKTHPTDGRVIASELTGYVTCKPETFDVLHDCFEPANNPTDPGIVNIPWETNEVLNLEWEKQRDVYKRNPEEVLLGDTSSEYYPW